MLLSVPALSLTGATGIAAARGAWRARSWRKGRQRRVPVLAGLMSVPRRYLVNVHEVVAREPRAARMHVLAAGGFVGAVILVLAAALTANRFVAAAAFIACLIALAGAGLAAWRRLADRTPRLSKGYFDRLAYALGAVAIFLAVPAAADAGLIGAFRWSSAGGTVFLIAGFCALAVLADIARGPMRHAFAGALNLAFHDRPRRFVPGANNSDLKPLDLSDERLGVAVPSDFTWTQRLSFDACVQCGRCEVVCPAFAAGQPLNPKKLIFDLVRAAERDAPDAEIVGFDAVIHPDTIWACTTCRACVDACPMMIEHVDAVIALRRFETLERGRTPEAAQIFENLAATDNVFGRPQEARSHWTLGLAVPVLATVGQCDILLWAGEAAFSTRGQRTLRALAELLKLANVDFAVLGSEERDCGDLARRLGEEALFQNLAAANIATLARYSFTRIVTADPHVFHCLKNEYPAFGGAYDVVHHTQLLSELAAGGCLEIANRLPISVTFHDPCYLSRYNGETEAPRALLGRIAAETIEMPRHGRNAFCCGAGGGASVTDIPGARRIPDIRMDEARATGAEIVAVACPNCALMFEGVSGPKPEIRDLAELMRDAVRTS